MSLRLKDQRIDRRTVLRGAVASSTFLLSARQPSLARATTRTPREVFERLKGPMASITMAYNKDHSIDHGSLRNWVDFMCEQGVPILFMTYGDSELYNLNEQEIEAVIRTVVDQANGRTLVLGGTPQGWTGQLVNFINRLEDSGVDGVSVHTYSKNEEEVYRALAQVAEQTHLPLLAYESGWSVDLVKRIAKLPQFVGMKCHAELYRYYDLIRATKNDDFGVLSAGQMKHFLFGYLIGSPAYLCPLTPFAPQIGAKFYHALQQGDTSAARQMIFDYEEPLLKVTLKLGYPHAYKSALYITGHYKTNAVRPPKVTNSLKQIEPLRRFLEQKGLLS